MIKQQWLGPLSALLMAAAVAFLGLVRWQPARFEALMGAQEPPYVAAMDKEQVLTIQIIAEEAQWAAMLANATNEEYIPVTVIINGVKKENVGLRPKGNSSLSMVAQDDSTDRYSFKIEFDHYIDGQTWLGLDKIVVNNMQGDATYMKEYLSYDLMDYMGVASPRYAFANISVNGAAWGFYLAVEALEDSYAERVYGSDHGKLYKPEGMGMGARGNGRMNDFIAAMQDGAQDEPLAQPQDQPQAMPGAREMPAQGASGARTGGGRGDFQPGLGGASGGSSLIYTGDAIESYAEIFDGAVFKTTDQDHRRLIEALKKLNAGEELASVVDVEATLRYFAAHAVIVNLDSYVSNMSHNYYLYEKDGRLTILPWDFNLAFGGFQSGSASSVVNFPIDTPVSGVSLADRPLLGKLLAVPEYLDLYHAYLRQIVDGYFNSGRFAQIMDMLAALIAPHVAADPSAFYDFEAHQAGVAALKELGQMRAQSIQGQLEGTIPATSAGQSANPDALVDASSVNLSALGSMGGGGRMANAMPGNPDGAMSPQDGAFFDPTARQGLAALVEAAASGALTQAQQNALNALGLDEGQLSLFASSGPAGAANAASRARTSPEVTQTPPASDQPHHAWLITSACALLLPFGLLFVLRYQRRRA